MVVLEEHQIGLGIGVVRHDRGEGKEEDGRRNEDVATAANLGGERTLGQLDTGHAGSRLELTGHQDDGGGTAADDDGVHKDPQHLHITLRGRVRRIGSGSRRSVGRRAHARFVGEETALDTVDHRLGDGITERT